MDFRAALHFAFPIFEVSREAVQMYIYTPLGKNGNAKFRVGAERVHCGNPFGVTF